MKTIKQIPHPNLAKARKLSPLKLNNIHLQKKHTVITEQLLGRLAGKTDSTDK